MRGPLIIADPLDIFPEWEGRGPLTKLKAHLKGKWALCERRQNNGVNAYDTVYIKREGIPLIVNRGGSPCLYIHNHHWWITSPIKLWRKTRKGCLIYTENSTYEVTLRARPHPEGEPDGPN